LKKLFSFVRQYWQFCFALVAAGTAFGLQLAGFDTVVHWILGITSSILVLPLLWSMVQDLRQGTYGIDILAATAIIVAVVMHEYWAAVVIVLMLTGGESLEDYAEHRAHRELDALLRSAPQKARLLRGKTEIEVAASEVREGDKLVIRPGEVAPVDAVILTGSSSFDESSLTGESLPALKRPGESIMSGSINVEGVITAEALHSAADSQYEQIIKLVRAANNSKAPFVRLADRYAIPFTIVSFGIAGIAWALSGESIRFLQVLVVATPCPLILAAPIAIISGMSRAAKQGIIIKNGSSLEKLALARTFAFDKTGTITAGRPQVERVRTYHGYKQAEVLAYAAALEQSSNHVLANAIFQKAQTASVKIPKAKNVRELAGHGLKARLNGKTILVGRLSLLTENNIETPPSFDPKQIQQTTAFVAVNSQLIGVITFRDEIRPEAKKTLQRLRDLGVAHFMMVTGDSKVTAAAVAKKVGIKTLTAEALPGDKIHAVEKATERPIAFVGDGVNDAPVLTASDVGIALGARGSTAASESADVVVMLDDLERVADGRMIAKRTFFIAKQSILVGIGLSVILMLVFATGTFKPVYGAAIQELVDVIVIFNALRAHASGKKQA
jgi:heavy metal translocating P-type ATPase